MKNEVPQDVVPPQKKSIRNIPIPDGRRKPLDRSAPRPETVYVPASRQVHDETLAHEPETLRIRPQPMHASKEDVYVREPEPVASYEEVAEEPRIRRAPPSHDEFEEEEEVIVVRPTSPRRVVSFDDDRAPGQSNKKRIMLVVGTLAGICLVVVLMFAVFGGATVTVHARNVTTTLNTELTAVNIASGATTTPGMLMFSATDLQAEASREVVATGEEQVTEKAKGMITIYNEYSEEEQRLVKNTRFESPAGLIFRIPDSVVVPGSTRDASGNVVAGKITTEVIADVAGKEYNIQAGRFTVPGFKDLPQYDGFYAISQNAMTGGFDGIKKIVSDEDRNKAERELREEIKQDLLAQAAGQTTEDLITFVDDSLTLYQTLDEAVSGDKVTLGMRGTTKAIVVKPRDLAHAVAETELNSFNTNDQVEIDNLNELKIRAFATTGDEALNTVRVAIEGDAEFEWQLNETAFKTQLAGSDKDTLGDAVVAFPAITKADAKIRPIWKGSFPSNPEKITIVYVKE